jgi:diguanylate cyclase (GGDEF)-like protein
MGVKHQAASRKGVWAAAAVLCVAVGVVGSVLGAHAVARNDAAKARQTFGVTSAGVATSVKLAIQHEEDLVSSASTFFSSKPTPSHAEFDAWAKWVGALPRYPELENLGLVTLLRAPQLPAFEARSSGHAAKVAGAPSGLLAGAGLRIIPASDHHYYCLTVAEVARSAEGHPPAGFDYCGLTPALLVSRNSGVSSSAPISVGRGRGLEVDTPVYRGEVAPSGEAGRMAASVGWLREVLLPGAVLHQALRGHSGYAALLGNQVGSTHRVFASGTLPRGGQSSTSNLHDGWTVTSFGPAVNGGVLADASALALLITGILMSALLGVLLFILGSGRGMTPASAPAARKRSQQDRKLSQEDLYDALTGLPNRALTVDRAACMVARAKRQSGMLAGALFIDVDWFKDVNDKIGQAAGDQLLTIVAQRLERVVRTGDTVGHLGADKFVVLVESAARGSRLDSLAQRVIEALHEPVDLAGFGPSFCSTASIGVAFGRYATPEDLMRDAQLALNAAKAAGKDRYTLFNANMRSMIESRAVLEIELNAALQDGQFFLLYQPIYDLTTRRVVGLEALIRWLHPKQGVLTPGEFLPLAEENGLIVPIGRWALEEACSRVAAWNVAGHRLGVSVKVSANQLDRDGFVTDVRRALQQSGIEPSLLTLEIAETTVIRDVQATTKRLEEVKALGVCIAIDDFGGSGYARHSDLQRMPLDFLRVDRSSLAASDDEDYRRWLLETIIVVGRDLSLTVIAKGVETYEQMANLHAMGCTLAQGFFLGKPTATDAVEALLDADLSSAPPTSASQSADVAIGV